jgi:hypothetical protein
MPDPSKSLVQMFEEAVRRPVPYEGLSIDPASAGFPDAPPQNEERIHAAATFLKILETEASRMRVD